VLAAAAELEKLKELVRLKERQDAANDAANQSQPVRTCPGSRV